MQISVASVGITQTYPGACCGFLALRNVHNPALSLDLEARKTALQAELRQRYPDESAIKSDPVLQAYSAYYKKFKKTYHVALQLESVALKGKSLPSVAALVESMFMAELEDRLLTAGHDLAAIEGGVTAGVAQGTERYTLLRGVEQVLKAGDLTMRDDVGIISSIIYGPDARTQITPSTTGVLYTVYAPPGVGPERVAAHLARIQSCVRLFSPQAAVVLEEILE